MKKTILCASLLLGLSSAAMAQDWSGFYIGPQVSYTWMNTSWQSSTGVASSNFYPDGFSLGPHGGWAYQMDAWVFALEGAYSGGTYSGQNNFDNGSFYKTKVSQLFTVTPLVGYTQDSWLFYGKAGYASGNVEADINSSSGNIWSNNERQSGWTAGLGASYKISEKDSIGVEYDYTHFGGTNFNSTSGGISEVNVNPININAILLNYTRYFW